MVVVVTVVVTVLVTVLVTFPMASLMTFPPRFDVAVRVAMAT